MALRQGIHEGDATDLLKKVTPGSIDLILTDPPYNVTQKNNLHTMGRRGIAFDWDGDFNQLDWLSDAVTALKPGGTFISFNDWKNLGDISKALTSLGMVVKRQLHWYKFDPIPRNRDRCVIQRMEYAVYAVKPGAKWTFNRDGAPTTLKPCCKPYLASGTKYCGACGRRVAAKGYEDGIFYHGLQKDYLHPTKKPDNLWGDIIKVFSNKGDMVLDPFSGVGTLAVAATRTERQHISFELDWLYAMWGRHRWKQELVLKTKHVVTV